MNSLVAALIRAAQRGWRWSQRHRYIAPAARAVRKHWLETFAVLSLLALIIAVNPLLLLRTVSHIEWLIALLMIPVALATYVFRGLAWYVGLRCIGVGISVWRTLAVEIAGQVMVFMPLGDLARVAMARRQSVRKRDPGELAGTIAFQELLFMTFLGLGVLPRVATQPDVALLVIAMTLAHAGIFTILLWKRAYDWAVRTVERVRVLRRFDKQLRELRPAFVKLFTPRYFVPIVLLNAIAAGLNFLLFYLALQALGQHQVGFVASAFVLGLSYILAGLSFVPGGLGLFEGLATVVMIGSGIAPATGAAVTLLYRGYNDVLMALIGGPLALVMRRATPRRGRVERPSAART